MGDGGGGPRNSVGGNQQGYETVDFDKRRERAKIREEDSMKVMNKKR